MEFVSLAEDGFTVTNFMAIYGTLIAAGAASITEDPKALAARVSELLSDPELRREAGERGRQVVLAHRGAVGRIVAILASWVDDRSSSSASGRGFRIT